MTEEDLAERDLSRTHHDLLNRIAVVGVYAELLREGKLTREQREMVDELAEAATRAHELALELTPTTKGVR